MKWLMYQSINGNINGVAENALKKKKCGMAISA
jgi:hypothetical protein